MRTALDFSPFYRSSIGFDRVFNLLENANRPQSMESWPPYDIVRVDENSYRVIMAVAGFAEADLDITHEPNLLIVTGEHKESNDSEYLHRGLAARPFVRRFELADHVKVAGASLMNGLLTIELMREVPEAMKPRRIQIGTGQPGQVKQVEGSKIAA
jgi:molecular chaperone IbpA